LNNHESFAIFILF